MWTVSYTKIDGKEIMLPRHVHKAGGEFLHVNTEAELFEALDNGWSLTVPVEVLAAGDEVELPNGETVTLGAPAVAVDVKPKGKPGRKPRAAAVASLVLALLCLAPVYAADWSETVAKLERSIVYVESEDGACTGWVIDQAKHYVMTAAHCYAHELYADLTPARIVSLDRHQDLMVIEAPHIDPARPALKLATHDPERGSEVMSAGYGYALESAQFRIAHVSDNHMRIPDIAQEFFSTDATFVPGQSGGPVVNLAGEVVMIVQRGSSSVGIGIGAETIRARMGRFFAK